eukprot:GHVU01020821.1.p1 GENE.GHVU01020821.1~~GHVU01020821.1.p1  ORF type:complete len:172 (-),score=9.36 GHVU01020821.1:1850-2365(-)
MWVCVCVKLPLHAAATQTSYCVLIGQKVARLNTEAKKLEALLVNYFAVQRTTERKNVESFASYVSNSMVGSSVSSYLCENIERCTRDWSSKSEFYGAEVHEAEKRVAETEKQIGKKRIEIQQLIKRLTSVQNVCVWRNRASPWWLTRSALSGSACVPKRAICCGERPSTTV